MGRLSAVLSTVFLVTLSCVSSAAPTDTQQLDCFCSPAPEAMKSWVIYYTQRDEENLYERKSLDIPLLNCSRVSPPVALDTCRVCVKEEEEEVIAVCKLENPRAELTWETNRKELSKTHCACPRFAEDPAPPATSAPPASDSQLGVKVSIAVSVLLFVVAAAVFTVICRKKM